MKSLICVIWSIDGSQRTPMHFGAPKGMIIFYWGAGMGVSTFDTINLLSLGLYSPLHLTMTPYGVSIPLNFDEPLIFVDGLISSFTLPV